MNTSPHLVLFDTTTLSNFAAVDRLDASGRHVGVPSDHAWICP